jgi:hypothetical protein
VGEYWSYPNHFYYPSLQHLDRSATTIMVAAFFHARATLKSHGVPAQKPTFLSIPHANIHLTDLRLHMESEGETGVKDLMARLIV